MTTIAAIAAHDAAAEAHERAAHEAGSTEYREAAGIADRATMAATEATPDGDEHEEARIAGAIAEDAATRAAEEDEDGDGNEASEAGHREAAEAHRDAARLLRA